MTDNRSKHDEHDITDYDGAEDETGIKKNTLYTHVAEKRIPHIRLGKRLVRFSRKALRAWLAEHTVPASDTSRQPPGDAPAAWESHPQKDRR